MFWVIFPKKKFILMILLIITVFLVGFFVHYALNYFSAEKQFDQIYAELQEQYATLKSSEDIGMRVVVSYVTRDEEGEIISQSNSTLEYLLDESYFQREISFDNYLGTHVEISQVKDLRDTEYFLERYNLLGHRSSVRISSDSYWMESRFDYFDTMVPFGMDTTVFQSLQVSKYNTERAWHQNDIYSFKQDPNEIVYLYVPNYSIDYNFYSDFDTSVLYLYYHFRGIRIESYQQMQCNFVFNDDNSMTVIYHYIGIGDSKFELELEMNFSYFSDPLEEIQVPFTDANVLNAFETRELAEKFIFSSADDIDVSMWYGFEWLTVHFEESQTINFPVGFPWQIYVVDGNYNMVNERIVVDAGSTLTFHVNMEESDESFILQSPFFLD